MEDRMLSDEILLALINKNSGGGGGGTGDYNDLENLPQIGGVTLQGNKSLGDFGIKNEFIGTKAQWNALTAEQRKAYDTYQFTDDFMQGRYIYLPTIYSEEERQVGVWKDGKPVYQKTYFNVPVSNNSDNIVDSNFGAEKNIQYHKIEFKGEGGNNRTDYNTTVNDTLTVRNGQLLYYFSKSGTWTDIFNNADITIQYTKTTDTAGSGIWTPSGEIAHHYSTDEQIVGTWVDGSTVWEKTQIGGIAISGNDVWYDTLITGVSKVVSFDCSLMRDNEQIGNSFNGGSIDYIVRDGVLKIKGHGFSQTENYSLGHLTVQYIKTA